MRNIVIEGNNIYFRPIELADIDRGWYEWVNDVRISSALARSGPYTRADLERYYHVSQPPDAVMFAICDKANDRYLGNARISAIDHINKSCTYGRLIGLVEYRGRGVGTESLNLLLRYGFDELGMNRIWTDVFAYNEASIRSNKKAGMTADLVKRQGHFKDGQILDLITFSMLRREFDALGLVNQEQAAN
jgi:RimJ/RimL family protein N-acetyltransferase